MSCSSFRPDDHAYSRVYGTSSFNIKRNPSTLAPRLPKVRFPSTPKGQWREPTLPVPRQDLPLPRQPSQAFIPRPVGLDIDQLKVENNALRSEVSRLTVEVDQVPILHQKIRSQSAKLHEYVSELEATRHQQQLREASDREFILGFARGFHYGTGDRLDDPVPAWFSHNGIKFSARKHSEPHFHPSLKPPPKSSRTTQTEPQDRPPLVSRTTQTFTPPLVPKTTQTFSQRQSVPTQTAPVFHNLKITQTENPRWRTQSTQTMPSQPVRRRELPAPKQLAHVVTQTDSLPKIHVSIQTEPIAIPVIPPANLRWVQANSLESSGFLNMSMSRQMESDESHLHEECHLRHVKLVPAKPVDKRYIDALEQLLNVAQASLSQYHSLRARGPEPKPIPDIPNWGHNLTEGLT